MASATRSIYRAANDRGLFFHGCRMTEQMQGVLELHPKGFGFLRNPARHYVPQQGDAYVGLPLINKLRLKEGLLLAGPTEAAKKGSGPRLLEVREIEGQPADAFKPRTFDALTPIDPREMITLETGKEPLTTRVM